MRPIYKLLTVWACITISMTQLQAQTSSSTTTNINATIQQQDKSIDPRVYFQSKLSAFDIHTSRNSKNGAESVYKDLKTMMEDFMKDTELKMMSANGDIQTKLQEKLKKQQSIYTSISGLSSDLIINQEAIKQKLNEFSQTLY